MFENALRRSRARKNHLPSGTLISIIGNVTGHTTSGSTTIALPAGCLVGDYAVISVSRVNTCTITPPAGSIDLMSDYTFYTTAAIGHIYGYTLTSTDITNGSIAFSATTTTNGYVLTVLRGTNATPVDVTGTPATANPNNTSPITIPANSITTTSTNDMVLAFGFAVPASSTGVTWTPPATWTTQSQPSGITTYQVAVYSLAKAATGATGNAPIGASASSNVRGAGIQIAFKHA